MTCMSWPHACITGTSWPDGSVPRAVLAYSRPVCSGTGRRVHVGAQPDDRPLDRCVITRRDAGLADALFELDAELGQALRDHPRRAGLLEGQLRMPVQIDVERFEVEGHGLEPIRAPPRRFGRSSPLAGRERHSA